jgi:predicted metal-dependent phosphoesterase TrpH
MKYDLHVHTKYSKDGYLDPETIIKTALRKGLSGVAVTDHDTVKGGILTKKLETEDLKVIVGSEIHTDRGEVIGLFLNDDVNSGKFMDVLDEIKDQDGLVITPHPFDRVRGNGVNLKKDDAGLVDCVEVYNSRCLLEKYNQDACAFARDNKLRFSAGSDAHFADEIGKAGVISPEIIEQPRQLLNKKILYYGSQSSFIYLGLTKVLKIWKKTVSG